MSDSEKSSFDVLKARNTFSNWLKQFAPLVSLTILLLPAMACADSFLMLHNGKDTSPSHETAKQTIKRSVTVGLNENGDLMIRPSDISLVMAYNPPNDIVNYQERNKIATRPDCPTINGISLKVSLLF